MRGKLTITGVNIVFFIFTVAFIGFQFLLLPLVPVFGFDFIYENVYGILLVNEFVIILVPVMVYIIRNKISLRDTLRFKSLNPMATVLIVLMAIPGCFVATALNNLVVYVFQFIGNIEPQPLPIPQNTAQLIIGILIVAVSPAICEELLHRGLLLRAYEKRGSYKAIVITGIFFGFFHFNITNFLGPIFLGTLFGYYVLRTDSIFAGMLAHFLNNAFAEIMLYVYRDQPVPRYMTISANDLFSSLIIGAGSFIILLLLLLWFRHVTSGKYRFKPSISRAGKDFASIISHWPIIVILVLYVFMLLINIILMIISKNVNINY